MSAIENSKVTIVGAGAVGSSAAYAALIRGSARHVALYDIATEKVEAEVLDLQHGTQFTGSSDIIGGSDVSVAEGSHVVVITAGAKQKPGQTRTELAGVNAGILRTMMPQLLEVAAQSARAGRRVLYASGEESTAQVRLRAERTGALHDELYLASETDLATILGHIDETRPDLVIVDSVQTVTSSLSDGAAGQPAQVREVAASLIRVAKERDLPIIIVGHVTKDGQVAGPRILEHLVDVVCHFEGDRQTSLRFVRALKNRFGPTDEVGCFDMTGSGIVEVADPSALFLGTGAPVAGTCVAIAMEGRRALPVEVQALTIHTGAPNPRRVVSGVDASRVAMVLAVLERRAGVKLSDCDVYVSTVGGVRLTEPAADLAIAIAVAGAVRESAVPRQVAAIGELSLAGEIRHVTQAPQRHSEAERLGYRTVLDASVGTIAKALRHPSLIAARTRDEGEPGF
ncbi:lactate/malate family dehydrogenase [Ralstonia pickettii]|uniref:lactate/malate family dehydrogenase n=1 Tax=Ralstonia pickettii TaxID=329 RepID=UPI0011AF8F77